MQSFISPADIRCKVLGPRYQAFEVKNVCSDVDKLIFSSRAPISEARGGWKIGWGDQYTIWRKATNTSTSWLVWSGVVRRSSWVSWDPSTVWQIVTIDSETVFEIFPNYIFFVYSLLSVCLFAVIHLFSFWLNSSLRWEPNSSQSMPIRIHWWDVNCPGNWGKCLFNGGIWILSDPEIHLTEDIWISHQRHRSSLVVFAVDFIFVTVSTVTPHMIKIHRNSFLSVMQISKK